MDNNKNKPDEQKTTVNPTEPENIPHRSETENKSEKKPSLIKNAATAPGQPGAGPGDCFITTACVEAKGLSDNCRELLALRHFRDSYVSSTQKGTSLVAEYYEIAPQIVSQINLDPDKIQILRDLYDDLVVKSIESIDRGDDEKALDNYVQIVSDLKNRFCI